MSQRTILLVDDDRMIRDLLKKELKRNFYKIFSAANGKSALELFSQKQIDIVLLDVNLPDIDGLEILQTIKEKKPECEVIVITGFGSQEIAIQSLRRGAVDYIEKPIRMVDLSAALGRAYEKLTEKEGLSYKPVLLVIDDEPEIVKRLKRFLEKEDYEVFSAYNGNDGLKTIESHKIDVVITDIKMDDMDGIEVLRRAKKLYPDIEGIIISGYRDQKLAVKSLRAGAMDYITKPVDLDELLFSISRTIERINLNRNQLYRDRELKITSEIISKMNEELEKRIEERSKALTQTQVQLFQTSKLATLGEMSAGMAHEMNQPLGGISLTARHLRKLLDRGKLSTEEIESGLFDIEASVKRMSRIINHIRTFARQDTLKFIQVDINETLESALSLLREQLRLHEITVVDDFDPDLPKIMGEPYQLEQVWINLISNARDAVDEKRHQDKDGKVQLKDFQKSIQISTHYHQETENVQIVVGDNGIGIPKEVKAKVFEPFFTTKEVGQSTGLGLSISYGIIESHKGEIEIDSQADAGTVARVTLPIGD